MKSRVWCLLVVAFVLAGVMSAQPAQFGDFTYESSDSSVTITGYTGPGGDVSIPETIDSLPVTRIGDSAFSHRWSLTSVTIPDSVTSIGEGAFWDCASLTGVSIGNSVINIGHSAFLRCTGLTSVTIPDSVTSIGEYGFSGCTSLASVTIGNGVTSIKGWAFFGCSGLTSMIIPDSVTIIEVWTFYGCSGLTSVTIPDSVTSIGAQAFSWCTGMTSITIPDSVTSIGRDSFYGCTGLTSITIPDSVTSIGGSAFTSCSGLASVVIPDSVTIIEGYTFSDCTGLTSVTIGNRVTSIKAGAFYGCSGLTSITIPDSVTSIGGGAFGDCTGLNSITIPDSVTIIEESTFSGCSGLTSVTIPDSVTSIGAKAFSWCTGMTSITIPDSVTSIGDGAFWGWTSFTLRIASGVASISSWNLASMEELTAIEVDPLNPVYSSVDGVLYDKSQTTVILCPRNKPVSVTIPASVTSIAYEAFKDCVGLNAVYFLGDAPAHADGAFANTPVTLFYVAGSSGWEATLAGRPTVSWNGLFGAQSLEMYAGLTIIGEIGKVYSVEYVTDLAQTNDPSAWRCLEYLELRASPHLWADKSASATVKRFYRAVAMEAPTNMVFIPPGTFRMGSPTNEVDRGYDEGPQTQVTISRGYWMGMHEVTQAEYEAVMGNNPSWFHGIQGEGQEWQIDYGTDLTRPVERVSWDDANEYCAKLTERERLVGRIAPNSVYRLPTEAEWEYACRGWTSTRFSYGDDPGYTNLTNYAWYWDNSEGQTHPVGQKLPNPWGLHDMHGNVFEWCQDWFGDYSGGIALDPPGPGAGSARVIRGGSWDYWDDFAWYCRSAYRYYFIPDIRGGIVGFRVVLAPGQS